MIKMMLCCVEGQRAEDIPKVAVVRQPSLGLKGKNLKRVANTIPIHCTLCICMFTCSIDIKVRVRVR